MSTANDIRSLIVGAAIGAGVVAHVLIGWPTSSIATRESEGPMVRAGQSGVAHASASEAPASPYSAPAADAQSTGPDLDAKGQEFTTKGPESAPKGPDMEAPMHTLDDLFRAIAEVETGGEPNPDRAVGDKGKSFGRYQIGLDYYIDAWYASPDDVDRGSLREALPGYMADEQRARETMLRYWRWHCPEALESGDWATLARVHNGGPRGAEKDATADYARRVLRAMER